MENHENNNVTPETEEVVEETPVVEEAPVVEETPVAEENPYGQDFANYQTEYVSKEEFIKNHEGLKKNVKIVAIISYVLIAINALNLLFNFFVIIDIAILLGCTLGVHLKKKKGCAIGILVYGIFSVVVGLLSAGTPTGWMWIVFAIIYLTQFNKVNKEYNAIHGSQI